MKTNLIIELTAILIIMAVSLVPIIFIASTAPKKPNWQICGIAIANLIIIDITIYDLILQL